MTDGGEQRTSSPDTVGHDAPSGPDGLDPVDGISPPGESGDTAGAGARGPSVWSRALPALALPLFFAIFFPLAYVSALHAPTPHHLQIGLVGSAQETAPILAGLVGTDPDRFDVTLLDSPAAAQQAVADREIVGAIQVGERVDVLVASGGGAAQARVVESAAGAVAARAGLPVQITDAAPLTDGDDTGVALFYLVIVCTLVGYLTITVLAQAAPDLALRQRLGVLVGACVVGPPLVFGIMSLFVGAYGLGIGGVLALLGVAALYAFTCGLVTLAVNQLVGRAAIFVVLGLMVLLNFPSTGGAVAVGLLPEFWQVVHSFWVGSGALETMHALVYFDGAGLGRWLVQLLVWSAVAVLVVLTVGRRRDAARAAAVDTGADTRTGRHEAHDAVVAVG